MWDKEEGEEDSSEEGDDDDEDESSEESDGMGGTMSRSAMASSSAGPSASGARQPAGAGTSTTGEKLRPGQIDRFGNVVPDEKADSTSAEREARREAKRLAKAKASGAQGAPKKQVQIQAPAKKAAASESDDESDSDDAAPAVLPPKSVASLTKQTKQVSLEPAKKATPSSAPPPMNRKERCVVLPSVAPAPDPVLTYLIRRVPQRGAGKEAGEGKVPRAASRRQDGRGESRPRASGKDPKGARRGCRAESGREGQRR